MNDLQTVAAGLQQDLRTPLHPIGIAYLDEPPEGIAHGAPGPASCSYWKRAADGEVFFTAADDHLSCPIGAHTHAAPMGEQKSAELMQMIGSMVQLGYLSMSEVPKIPQRKTPLRFVVYAPLSKMPVAPDVVLVRGTVAQLMLVTEAAQAAGFAPDMPAMGRPTCAALPQAEQSGKPAVSLGCIGNRVYTGLADGEGYVAIPAAALTAVAEKLKVLARANIELEKFHRSRL
jgi:uncharacterized protein (DUF169 family)